MIQTYRPLLAAFATCSLMGCGTINTVFRDDDVAKYTLREWNTHCQAIPRVYSGVFYNLCTLHSSPATTPNLIAVNAIPLQILDFIPSGILDTVVLPYSVYQQSTRGNININP
ncbi:YceK/YidQ family lipoprotein [Pseudomonas sp. N3-W]|uniref:YceK/YidQ family lipoprotein n=1 Tax=Pseudomonas sp. N3-W TaxID=2975049 RepID=UPI00217E6AD6|nr:YceK/YidQ family lipoprotein [Pseudomonas sp. N3-W]UWF52177.1 YceK/YidQ family lipoprotein [Pseudomonas sp. N3-W]